MRVLITGVTGMTGSHLAGGREQESGVRGQEPAGQGKLSARLLEDRVTTPTMLADHSEPGKLNLVYGELNDPVAMQTVIATVRLDRIFHPSLHSGQALAAQSFVPASWSAPAEMLSSTVLLCGKMRLP
jgi:GDP-4-dehydro-6-deoxy-D-mannose reductase